MTDLEMTKLCAEAMGFKNVRSASKHQVAYNAIEYCDDPNGDEILYDNIYGHFITYDPIHGDAQAMALVKRFKLNIGQLTNTCQVFSPLDAGHIYQADNADLNRAIVECVAKLTKMEEMLNDLVFLRQQEDQDRN